MPSAGLHLLGLGRLSVGSYFGCFRWFARDGVFDRFDCVGTLRIPDVHCAYSLAIDGTTPVKGSEAMRREAKRHGARLRTTDPLDGKEGVDGSSPSEGFSFLPA